MVGRENLHRNHLIVNRLKTILEHEYRIRLPLTIIYSSNKFSIFDKRNGNEYIVRFDSDKDYIDVAKEIYHWFKRSEPIYPTSRPESIRSRSIFDSFADRKYQREIEYDEMREREREYEKRLREIAREEEVHVSWMRTKTREEEISNVVEKWRKGGILDHSDRSERINKEINQIDGFEILPTFELNI